MTDRPVLRWNGTVHPGCSACSGTVVKRDGRRLAVVTPHATPSTLRTGMEVKQPGRRYGPVPLRVIRDVVSGRLPGVLPPVGVDSRADAYRRQNAAGGARRSPYPASVLASVARGVEEFHGLTTRQNRRLVKKANRAMRRPSL